MGPNPPTQARITLPDWLWGGDPKQLLREADYRFRAQEDGSYLVQTIESYRRQPPDLVRLRTIAETGTPPRWANIEGLKERVTVPTSDRVLAVLERRRSKADATGDLLDVINHRQLLLYATPLKDLPAQSRSFVESLKSVRFEENPENGPFENVGLHAIDLSPVLGHRLKVPSVWLRIEQDALLGSGDAGHIGRMAADAGETFDSSSGLHSGGALFDAYLGPLLAAGTPGIWAVHVTRSFGSLLFDLGALISGTRDDAAEMLQLISVPGADEVVHFPRLSSSAAGSAIRWWATRLNLLFGVLSDLSTSTDAQGSYRPAKQLETLLTVEQVFRRTTSMLLAHRDTNARRTLLFSILDSLEGMRGVDFLTMCTLGHATKVLQELESEMPEPAAELLLPSARRAVQAVSKVQDGFFIRRQLGTERVELQLNASTSRSLTAADAAARYLKILRDATHGHGSNKDSSKAMTDALLAHHNGHVPHDIGLLGYLYLLDVLMHPSRVRQRLHRGGR